MDRLTDAYHFDPKFRSLVEMIVAHLYTKDFTVEEFLGAIFIANAKYQQRPIERKENAQS